MLFYDCQQQRRQQNSGLSPRQGTILNGACECKKNGPAPRSATLIRASSHVSDSVHPHRRIILRDSAGFAAGSCVRYKEHPRARYSTKHERDAAILSKILGVCEQSKANGSVKQSRQGRLRLISSSLLGGYLLLVLEEEKSQKSNPRGNWEEGFVSNPVI